MAEKILKKYLIRMAHENANIHLIGTVFGTPWFFGVAKYQSDLKIQTFKMADPIWRTIMQVANANWTGWNSVLKGF